MTQARRLRRILILDQFNCDSHTNYRVTETLFTVEEHRSREEPGRETAEKLQTSMTSFAVWANYAEHSGR